MQAAHTLPMTVPTQDDVGWTWLSHHGTALAFLALVPVNWNLRNRPLGSPGDLPSDLVKNSFGILHPPKRSRATGRTLS